MEEFITMSKKFAISIVDTTGAATASKAKWTAQILESERCEIYFEDRT